MSIPWEEVFENLGEGVCIISEDKEIIYANRLARDAHNIGEGVNYCYKVLHGLEDPCKECPGEKIKPGEIARDIHIHTRKDGSTYWCEVVCTLFEHGSKRYLLMSMRDVTERVLLREKLEKSLNMEKLLLDILTHDVINIAGIIYGNLEILREVISNRVAEHLEKAISNSTRMITLLNNVRLLSTIEKYGEIKNRISLKDICAKVAKILEEDAKARNIKILLPENDIVVFTTPIIEEVVFNYLSNAIKYSPEGSPVEIRLKKERDCAIIEVADYGEGVPDEHKDKIFRRFERLDKRGIKGHGIGLAIVQKIAEQTGGRAWVEDNKPRGSIFKFSIPAK